MIKKDGKEIIAFYFGRKPLLEMYVGNASYGRLYVHAMAWDIGFLIHLGPTMMRGEIINLKKKHTI
jgi:hypothetical protein